MRTAMMVTRWASLMLHHCCQRGRVDVAKYWSIVAKQKHVNEVVINIWEKYSLDLQKNKDFIVASISVRAVIIRGVIPRHNSFEKQLISEK